MLWYRGTEAYASPEMLRLNRRNSFRTASDPLPSNCLSSVASGPLRSASRASLLAAVAAANSMRLGSQPSLSSSGVAGPMLPPPLPVGSGSAGAAAAGAAAAGPGASGSGLAAGGSMPAPAAAAQLSGGAAGVAGSAAATGPGARRLLHSSSNSSRGSGQSWLLNDVWSLGCLTFELLTGRMLFGGGDYASVTHRVAFGGRDNLVLEPHERAALGGNAALAEFVEWVLARDPAKRPGLVQVEARLKQLQQQLWAQTETQGAPVPVQGPQGAVAAEAQGGDGFAGEV